MAETKITKNEIGTSELLDRNFIVIANPSQYTLTGSSTIVLNSTLYSSGSLLTRSGSTVVIGAGVSYVQISYTVMTEGSSSSAYLYTRIRKNTVELSQAIDAASSVTYRSTSETIIIPVTSGDVIDLAADTGTGSVLVRASSNSTKMTVRAIA